MPWDLFAYKPRKCYHPELEGRWFPAIIVAVEGGNVVVFNLNYMMVPPGSLPGSGHAYTPYARVKLTFDEGSDEWLMRDEGGRQFRFALPDPALEALFDNNVSNIPSFAAMQEKASMQFRE